MPFNSSVSRNLDDLEESATAKGRLGRGYLPLGEREGGPLRQNVFHHVSRSCVGR